MAINDAWDDMEHDQIKRVLFRLGIQITGWGNNYDDMRAVQHFVKIMGMHHSGLLFEGIGMRVSDAVANGIDKFQQDVVNLLNSTVINTRWMTKEHPSKWRVG